MDKLFWELFKETGEIEYYLLKKNGLTVKVFKIK